jgi:DNA-binding beta-propeller fold protein YncE
MRDRGLATIEFAISPDGRRAFSVWQQNLYTYDLEHGRPLEKVTTGRMSSRILAALDASTATETSRSEARRDAMRKGKSHYYYTEYSVRDPDQTLAVRPDSKAVYVLNRQTSDVTIVDAETGTILEKAATDGFAIHFLPGAGVALVVDSAVVHTIDLASHKKLDDLTGVGCNFTTPEISPDGRYAVVNGGVGVMLIDGGAGKPSGKLVAFKRVADLEIAWE